MNIAYMITLPELEMLGNLTCRERWKTLDYLPSKEADDKIIIAGLIEKGYLTRSREGFKIDRMIAGLVKVIAQCRSSYMGKDGKSCLYIHNKLAIYLRKDEHSIDKYKLIPMQGPECFWNSSYGDEVVIKE